MRDDVFPIIVGEVFPGTQLKILEDLGGRGKGIGRFYLCLCTSCGTRKEIRGCAIQNGQVKSCGCYRRAMPWANRFNPGKYTRAKERVVHG